MSAEPTTIDSIRRFVTPGRLLTAATIAAVLTALLALIWREPALESHEHWTGDPRVRWQSGQLSVEHAHVAIVAIDEATMVDQQVRSPIDRRLLANLITAIATAKPRAIGLDIVIDQKAPGDEALATSIRRAAAAGVPVVLATVDNIVADAKQPGRLLLPKERLDAQEAFLRAAGNPPSGHNYLRRERDGVIRARLPRQAGRDDASSFAAVLAKAGGVAPAHLQRLSDANTSRRIDWLVPAGDRSTPFTTIPALVLRDGTVSPDQRRLLTDRVVLIGGTLDGIDEHQTPLSGTAPVHGVEVHAQMLAQILDGRFFRLISEPVALLLTFLTASLGVLIGWGWQRSGVLAGVAMLVPYLLLDTLLMRKGIVLPFLVPLLAWGGGLMIGEALQFLTQIPAKAATLRERVAALSRRG